MIIGSSITLRKVNINPYAFDKMYMNKDVIEDKLYQIINQFNERKITSTKFYSMFLNKIHPFYDGNSKALRYCLLMMIQLCKIYRQI